LRQNGEAAFVEEADPPYPVLRGRETPRDEFVGDETASVDRVVGVDVERRAAQLARQDSEIPKSFAACFNGAATTSPRNSRA
jgi:hypothetical protein